MSDSSFALRPLFSKLFLAVIFAAPSLFLLFYIVNGSSITHLKQTQQLASQQQVLGTETQKEGPGLPVSIRIPKINVSATVEYVKLTAEGAMEVPHSTFQVGWFELGPRPGEKGSAVVAGHFNGPSGEAGVFANLDRLQKGDKIYIEDNKGTSYVFNVRESRAYDPGYADEVFSQNDGAHLNLVTCEGAWNETQKTYSKRLVVFTDLEP